MTREELVESLVKRLLTRERKTPKVPPKFKVGSVVEVQDWSDNALHVLVTKKHRYIKNGRAGFEGTVVKSPGMKVWPPEYRKKSDREKWFYNDQVVKVVSRG